MTTRTFFRIQADNGKFYTGNPSMKFSKNGKYFLSFAEAEASLAKVFFEYSNPDSWIDRLKIVEEHHIIEETDSAHTLNNLKERLLHRQHICKHFSKGRQISGTRIQYDLDNIFPTWDIDGFNQVVHFGSTLSIRSTTEIPEFAKQIGLKRTQYKHHNRTMVVKTVNDVIALRLAVPAKFIHLDLTTI